MLPFGPQHAEHRGAEQNAGEQLPHHGRLADALHRFAEQAPGRHQHHQLDDEKRLRGALVALGREGAPCEQQQDRSRPERARRVIDRSG